MNMPIEQCFQIGLIASMAYPQGYTQAPDEVLSKLAKDEWFTVIEVNPIAEETVRQKCAAILHSSHAKVCYSAHGKLMQAQLNPNSLNEEERKQAVNALCAGVDEAEALGATGIAFLSGKWQPETRQYALAQLIKTTQEVCAYAAQKGMFVELEVFDYDIDKASLIGPASLALEYAAAVRTSCSNFGLMVDLSHIPMCYETSRFTLQLLRPYITHLHIGNTVILPGRDAYGDEHPRFGFAHSANDVPQLTEFFTLLKQEGFIQPQNPLVLSIEVKPRPDEDPEIIIANSKRVVQRAWALA